LPSTVIAGIITLKHFSILIPERFDVKTASSLQGETSTMAVILACVNQKGGVGKSTTVLNLGDALSELGMRVLVIDLDPQAALTVSHTIDPFALERTIYHVFRDERLPLSAIIIPTQGGPDIAPANIDLSGAEVELVNEMGREHILKEKIAPLLATYDFILIDCSPSLGLLTINALTAADGVLIPVQTHHYALRALNILLVVIQRVKTKLNPSLEIVGFLPTMYEARTRHSIEVVEALKNTFGDKVFDFSVKRTVKFPDSSVITEEDFAGAPTPNSLLRYDPHSEHAEVFRQLARQVIRFK
jgi:chromosome partitioning protein